MDIHTNIPLKSYLTMRLGGNTRFMADAHTPSDVATICQNCKKQQIPLFVIGGGSNTLATDDGYTGLILRMLIKGTTVVEDTASYTIMTYGAGENWDEIVAKSVDMSLTGIEAMSAIPGTIGGAPVQNVGAYGQELADTFVQLEAYDTQQDTFVILNADDCQFSYRDSIFRGEAWGRYVITSVTLKLYKSTPQQPFYKAVQDYFDANHITLYTPQSIRDAVIAIRAEKLPDPAVRPNTGSFFKNAIIETWQLNELLKDYPDAPHYDLGNGTFKVPSGWLIEQTGLKGSLLHGIRVNDKNALVLINESATTFNDLYNAKEEVISAVRDKFRIVIEQEPLQIS